MKKTIFLIILLFLCAQNAGAVDVVADDHSVQGNACIGENCSATPPFSSNVGDGTTTLWLDGGSGSPNPLFLMRDGDSGEGDFTFYVDNSEFGIYDEDAATRVFGIESGAPEDSLFITSTGTVQSTFNGSNSVGDGLSVLYDISVDNQDLSKVSDAGFSLENAKRDFKWAFRTNELSEGFAATKLGTGGVEFRINNATGLAQNVSLNLANGASCSSTGQWINASSRDYKENIQEITSTEAMKTLKDLQPVKYNFKRDPLKDPTVGFIAEDVPDLLATKDRKGLSPLEIVAVLTKVVQEQQALVAKLSERITELEKE